ncbi:hypothetical protein F6X40_09685 [Paraburkholderia sp. UCT31]|uniref:hypothetical protein n=1 Tax=Paraburkholderia sp. UCT31 TaxID=2615209 RepID=UPI0016559F36|nr:hypothetical protein [Paraburkholderia sp. UCT31]MBC8737079.1 hypothetical protein [Paraburkholderia sp. UCT31]
MMGVPTEQEIFNKASQLAKTWMWPDEGDYEARTPAQEEKAKVLRSMLRHVLTGLSKRRQDIMVIESVSELYPDANVMGLILSQKGGEVTDEDITEAVDHLALERLLGPRDKRDYKRQNLHQVNTSAAFEHALANRMYELVAEGINPLSKGPEELVPGFEERFSEASFINL